jgi:hypothetical protein
MDWWDEWDCLCNDRCPKCNAEIEPDDHEAIEGEKSGAIRTLNDRLRRSMMGGRVVLTSGVYALPPEVKEKVLQAVRSFDAFDNGNDPHKEHDFGNFELGGERYFLPATSQLDWLISMTAISVPSGSRGARDRLRSFNFCMGCSIGSNQRR